MAGMSRTIVPVESITVCYDGDNHLACLPQASKGSLRTFSSNGSNAGEKVVGAEAHVAQEEKKAVEEKEEERGPSSPEQSEQQVVLESAMGFVLQHGWSEQALVEGAKHAGFSPSIIGLFSRGEAHLVEHFMECCKQRLREEVEAERGEGGGEGEARDSVSLEERIVRVVRHRLELQGLYAQNWAQALSIQARPSNIVRSLEQRKELVEEMWSLVGEGGSSSGGPLSPLQLHSHHLLLASVYTTAELYMLTDFSPGFTETWAFVARQVKSAFELKQSATEAAKLGAVVASSAAKSLSAFLSHRT